ncbi:larval cuticle protein 16/17-like [Macrobrachium nipponense]|uniref:larval cuticle protein 16/17-like n=1 Tax=Macrobrachium nipponense TaxID=159736 RepID=UPI0030C8BFA1
MKLAVIVLFSMGALVLARPDSVLDVDLEDILLDQDIAEDSTVTGSYTWTDPDGNQHFVKYVADEDGYRVLESNVVPATADGVRANGEQGSFVSLEDLDDK